MPSPSLIIVDPNGRRTHAEIESLPFKIGRQADNHLILRDSRISRNHARIVVEGGEYVVEDAGSRHGVFVNSRRIQRQALRNSDRIEFGYPDCYCLIYTQGTAAAIAEHLADPAGVKSGIPGVGANLAKLRAILEVGRALQTSFSMDDVLGAVVDAALAVTGAERGFLLLRTEEDLEIRIARGKNGGPLDESDLRVPRCVIHRALKQRRDLLSMSFNPLEDEGLSPEHSVADLELRSVVCVPLVRINTSVSEDTSMLSTDRGTVGVLYMDSRRLAADLSGGNRELLQTLALEASTVLENARLLEEERIKQKIEEELNVARTIQRSLLPRELPATGWFRACGSSLPSHQVGGDYFDVVRVDEDRWSAVVADVSGKGVSSALLASLLQGAFIGLISAGVAALQERICRVNRFLWERTGGGKYATVFFCLLDRDGQLHYINAGHCSPLVVSRSAGTEYLETTAVPLGLLEGSGFPVARKLLAPGDKVVIYSDGITEAQNAANEFFGRKRLRAIALANAAASCETLHEAVREAVVAFTKGADQSDDMTLLILEYRADASAALNRL
ncbi:MAG: SpoIIE family protein phosphatase [Acidobacteria bacterium]|nr:SpoIIE family protein phosphatase [Acidobacteriota bacterium]